MSKWQTRSQRKRSQFRHKPEALVNIELPLVPEDETMNGPEDA